MLVMHVLHLMDVYVPFYTKVYRVQSVTDINVLFAEWCTYRSTGCREELCSCQLQFLSAWGTPFVSQLHATWECG